MSGVVVSYYSHCCAEVCPIPVLDFRACLSDICIDTPWDEPSSSSIEYVRYVHGEIFHDPPWNRIGGEALSGSSAEW